MNGNQFQCGIDEFNRGCYFECHDILEDLWHETRGTDRLFLQGLIQISVGFYHLSNGNYKGAASQLTRGLSKLEDYRPEHRKVDLDELAKSVVSWLGLAEAGLRGEFVQIDESRFPKLNLTSVPEKENE